jgi:hypothetical protein
MVAAWLYGNTRKLMETGTFTNGKVIDLLESSSSDETMYKPVFEYTDRRKEKITFKSSFSSRPAAYKIGEKVKIIYTSDGKNQRIVSYWGLYLWTIILLCIAFPMFIIGGGYLLYIRG